MTDDTGNNSGVATKRFVDSYITITGDAVNEVGDPHTFTATLYQDDGLPSEDGNGDPLGDEADGFTPTTDPDAHIDVDLSDFNGAISDIDQNTSTCDNAGGNLTNGSCVIVFTSDSAGVVTGYATGMLTVDGVSMTRMTDDTGNNSGVATKRFVDALIEIAPDGKNFIYDPHTFTVTVKVDDGLPAEDGNGDPLGDGANGFKPFAGAFPDVTFDDTGANHSVIEDLCADDGINTGTDANGECTVTITSDETGTTTAHAAVSITGLGVGHPIERETDGIAPNSDDAVKTWVSGSVTFTKTFESGPFTDADGEEVCFTLSRTSYTGAANPEPAHLSSDSAYQCATVASGSLTITWDDLLPGDHKIVEDATTVPAGYTQMDDVTFTIPNDVNADLSVEVSAHDPLEPGSFRILKTISGSNQIGSRTFDFRVQPCSVADVEGDGDCDSPGTQLEDSPFTVDAAHNPLTISGLDEGYYLVTEINIPGDLAPEVNPQIVQVFAGDSCANCPLTVTFNNIATEDEGLFHTQTSCANFVNGTGLPIVDGDITYGTRSNGTIRNVSPGVFFFYATYTVSGNQDDLIVDVSEWRAADESVTADFTAAGAVPSTDFSINNQQAFLYRVSGAAPTASCTTLSSADVVLSPSTTLGPDVVITYDPAGNVPQGKYVLGVKYTPSSALTSGVQPCGGTGPTCRYWFLPSRDGADIPERAVNFLFKKKGT
jgi:hypothetical protein